jgi:hypothetical protein
MKRFLTVIAATAASAAVTAAITLPAGASDQASPKDAPFVACLRDHGLAIPADTTGDAIKGWLLGHENVDAALSACKPPESERDATKVTEITACLTSHGATPPTDIAQLKPWLAEHSADAAVKACGFDVPPKDDHVNKAAGPCGGPSEATAAKKVQRAT